MDDARLALAVANRGHLRVAREERAAQAATLRERQRRARHAGGLRDDHELGLLETDVERELRLGRELRRLALERDARARLDDAALFCAPPVDAHEPAVAQLCRALAAELGQARAQELVEPLGA